MVSSIAYEMWKLKRMHEISNGHTSYDVVLLIFLGIATG